MTETSDEEAYAARIIEIKREAEEKSPFKKHQLVRACVVPGISFETGAYPHDHNDPKQHFNSRVIGWDSLGRVRIATEDRRNPHCSDWPWSDDMLHPREDRDWFPSSGFVQDQEIFFIWELPGYENDKGLGRKVEAIIKTPHIEQGDWIVLYKKLSGDWITRVLNERQMIPR